MHIWVFKNSGYNLISIVSSRILDWTHTFDTHCIYIFSIGNRVVRQKIPSDHVLNILMQESPAIMCLTLEHKEYCI